MGDYTRRTDLVNIDRTTYLQSFDSVHPEMIQVLGSWMENEQRNLDGYITHPEEHVDYDPYLIPDFTALNQRSAMLGQAKQGLDIIYSYKTGSTDVTKAMHDLALDNIPAPIFERLYDWMAGRYQIQQQTLAQFEISPTVPIKDYVGLVSFNKDGFIADMNKYKESIDGLGVVIDYKLQQMGM